MNLCLSGVVSAEQLAGLQQKLSAVEFVDGATTAGWHARTVKQNSQARAGDPAAAEIAAAVAAALQKHPVFNSGVQPRRMRTPLISRYLPGMNYGTHIDNALMGGATDALRTDVAVTVFLNDPADYDGGELVIEAVGGEQSYKLPAGDAIAYPATNLHRVREVTRGTRLAAVTWVQSSIRDVAQREILFDLNNALRSLFQREGKSREFDLLAKTYANLMRMWAEL